MTHRRAVATMLAVTLMWSIAGVVTRHLEAARSFEVTFWRSLFNAGALAAMLTWLRGGGALVTSIRNGGLPLWISGVCWSVMFTAFMVALMLTTVANVLVTMSIAPLLTALVARLALGHRLAWRTWAAIAVAGAGIAWMYAGEVDGSDWRQLTGIGVALCVPIAAAVNWTVIQHVARRPQAAPAPDMLPAVLVGALISVATTLPASLPWAGTAHDLALLAMLGVVQLAIPCLLSVTAARALSAPEIALLCLLEVVFGIAWAWIGADEAPSASVLVGGALVLGALAANEALALRRVRA